MSALLDNLLRELRQEGSHHSSGSFTLDPKRAEKKLRKFRLPLPQAYAVKVVQYAVCRGAKQIDIRERGNNLEIQFDGEPIESIELEGLLNYLLFEGLDSSKPHLPYLAAALRGAVAVEPLEVSFESSDGVKAFRKTWTEEHWSVDSIPAQGTYSKFAVQRSGSRGLSFAIRKKLGLQKKQETELGLVEQLCGYCPAQITIDGKVLAPTPFGLPALPEDLSKTTIAKPESRVSRGAMVAGLYHKEHHLLERYLTPFGLRPSLTIPASSASRLFDYRQSEDHPGRCQGWIGLRAELASISHVLYVDSGVTLTRKTHRFACPGLVMVFSSEDLKKDLSGFKLVEDRTYRRHLKWLEDEAKLLAGKLEESLESHPEAMQRRIIKALARCRKEPNF